MTTLYDLTDEFLDLYRAIEDSIDADDASVDPDLVEILEHLSDRIRDKAEGVCKVIRTLERESAMHKAEAQEQSRKASRKADRAKWLKDYLQEQMRRIEADSLKAGVFSVRRQQSPPSVRVLDADALPRLYWVPQDPRLDKRALLEKLKSGEDVPGAELERGEHVRIT